MQYYYNTIIPYRVCMSVCLIPLYAQTDGQISMKFLMEVADTLTKQQYK